jgi:succinate dehydrogenase / fumarate reductase flavoprotein subunit
LIYDVLVVGSGIAGIRAAIEVKRHNLKVAVLIKANPLRSNSSMASGGINCAFDDEASGSVEEHISDTMRSSQNLADRRVVETLCKNAKEHILELNAFGVPFDSENEKISTRPFGGTGKKRTCYVQDRTGSAIAQGLIMKAREMQIEFLQDYFILNILKDRDRVAGVSTLRLNDSSVVAIACKSLVLAGGGFAGIYKGHSTNPQGTSGDMLALALRAGLTLRDLEFMQFHPTGLKHTGSLISEAARGEGAYLVNSNGERFVNELESRDVVSRAIFAELKAKRDVFLDLRHLGEELINKKLPSVRKISINAEGVDPVTELIPIRPVAHYSIGGIKTEIDTSTEIKGLFCAGECSSSLAHGGNRLGGNSLLEASVFGKMAGNMASRFAKAKDFTPIDYQVVEKDVRLVDYIMEGENRYNSNSLRKSLGDTLYKKVGVVRDESSLIDAFEYIEYMRNLTVGLHCINKEKSFNVELVNILEFINSLSVAEAFILSAIKRKESRGNNIRSDYIEPLKEFEKHIIVQNKSNRILKVDFEENSKLKKALNKLRGFLTN